MTFVDMLLFMKNDIFLELDHTTTFRCESFSEKTSEKSTCAVMVRIIITFANQTFP